MYLMYLFMYLKILINALFSSSFIGQSNICMTSNLLLTEMLTITEKSALFKRKSIFRRAHILENTYLNKSYSLQMNNAWYIFDLGISHTYPTMIKLGRVIPYLKKIQKTNGQKRYQQSATFVVIRNFLMSDLKNDIFKITFLKFKCSQNCFEPSLLVWQSLFTIIQKLYRHLTVQS